MAGNRIRHLLHARALIACAILAALAGPAPAADLHVDAAGPIGSAYVGLLYGLVDPADGSWYTATISDWFDTYVSTSWGAAVDTGASACVMGKTTQELYAGSGDPIPVAPGVVWQDEGFGGTADFSVSEPVGMMIADFALMDGDTEDHSRYAPYGPIGSPEPTIRMALANQPLVEDPYGIGLGDFDIIGMSVLEGRLLHVDTRNVETVRYLFYATYGSLTHPDPPADDPRNIRLPVTMTPFFDTPQPVDVGNHPMLPVTVRRGQGQGASAMAFFDSGSPVNFVSESFAAEAGVDVNSAPELSVTVSGVGGGVITRYGWYVDSLALDMAAPRNDQLVVSNTGVFVIPDEEMPGGLEFIMGNGVFGPAQYSQDPFENPNDSPFLEWYLDTRDPDDPELILVLDGLAPLPGDANLDGVVGIADLSAVADNYGKTEGVSWIMGDFNQDGQVGIADLSALADHYGEGYNPGSTVPEPTTVALLLVACTALLRRRKHSP